MHLNPEWRFVYHPYGKSYAVKSGEVIALDPLESALLFQNMALLQKTGIGLIPARLHRLLADAVQNPVSPCIVESKYHLRQVQLEINQQCNLACSHCYSSSGPHGSKGLPEDVIGALISEAAAMGVIDFHITGGEPLLRADIFRHLEAINRAGMRGGLFTNATLLTPERIERLAGLNLSFVQSSLDGHTAELHDAVRGRKGAFDKAVRGIKQLKAAGVHVRVNVCANRTNLPQIPEIAEFLMAELGVPLYIDRSVSTGRATETGEFVSSKALYEVLAPLIHKDRARLNTNCGGLGESEAKTIEPYCGVGSSYLYIKHDGRVVMCPTMTETEGFFYQGGVYPNRGLADIWEHDKTFQDYRSIQCENIQHCPAAAQCKGGCRSDAQLAHGKITSPDEYHCNVHKNESLAYVNYLEEYSRSKRRIIRLVAA